MLRPPLTTSHKVATQMAVQAAIQKGQNSALGNSLLLLLLFRGGLVSATADPRGILMPTPCELLFPAAGAAAEASRAQTGSGLCRRS